MELKQGFASKSIGFAGFESAPQRRFPGLDRGHITLDGGMVLIVYSAEMTEAGTPQGNQIGTVPQGIAIDEPAGLVPFDHRVTARNIVTSFDQAASLFEEMALAEDFPVFLTLPAYEMVVAEGG